MTEHANQFNPSYAVPPGWILEERLDVHNISHAEFARRCGRSPKLISEIISGKASLGPETALQFEKVLGVSANVWLSIEARYKLRKARNAEAEVASTLEDWAKSFPIGELVQRGCFSKPESVPDMVSKLLRFFGVASADAWKSKYSKANVAYRHSESFDSDVAALSTWLRLGELVADDQICNAFNFAKFRSVLSEIRQLSLKPVEKAIPEATRLCNESGVALLLVKPLPKTALSGTAWWQSSSKAVLQLSARHKTNDQFWFSFFHEAAHILLHGKRHNKLKSVFVDGRDGSNDSIEDEANAWAFRVLIPEKSWNKFCMSQLRSAKDVRDFASDQNIAPGIVVGRLQTEGLLPWSHLNGLKEKIEWVNPRAH